MFEQKLDELRDLNKKEQFLIGKLSRGMERNRTDYGQSFREGVLRQGKHVDI